MRSNPAHILSTASRLGLLFLSIALPAHAGDLYWVYTHPSNGSEVMTADLDGSNVSSVVAIPDTSGLGVSTGKQLAIDAVNGRFYVTVQDFGVGKIYRGNLDGSNFEDLTMITVQGPGGVGLDVANDALYFSEGVLTDRLSRSALDGSGQTGLISISPRPGVLAVDLVNGHIYFQDGIDGVGRSNLDGTGATIVVPRLAVNQGVAVDPAAGFIYYSALSDVYRANLDGTGETLLFSMQSPDAVPRTMAIDKANGKLYLAAAASGSIVQTNLDGTGYTRVIPAGPAYQNLNGVAVLESAPPVPLTIVPFAIAPLLVLLGVAGMNSKRRE